MSDFEKGANAGVGFGCGCLLFVIALIAVFAAIGAISHAVQP